MLSHGADYIFILPRATARVVHGLGWDGKSRRVASGRARSLSFRISRYRVIHQRVNTLTVTRTASCGLRVVLVETSHGIAGQDMSLADGSTVISRIVGTESLL